MTGMVDYPFSTLKQDMEIWLARNDVTAAATRPYWMSVTDMVAPRLRRDFHTAIQEKDLTVLFTGTADGRVTGKQIGSDVLADVASIRSVTLTGDTEADRYNLTTNTTPLEYITPEAMERKRAAGTETGTPKYFTTESSQYLFSLAVTEIENEFSLRIYPEIAVDSTRYAHVRYISHFQHMADDTDNDTLTWNYADAVLFCYLYHMMLLLQDDERALMFKSLYDDIKADTQRDGNRQRMKGGILKVDRSTIPVI